MRRAFLKAAAMFGLMPSVSLKAKIRPKRIVFLPPILVGAPRFPGIARVIGQNFSHSAYGVTEENVRKVLEEMWKECLEKGQQPEVVAVSAELREAYFRY